MSSNSSNYRNWWQPPRKIIDREEDRSLTFLELFYDLVYVVLIAELAHSLATGVTVVLLLVTAIYGVVVWIKAFGGEEIPIAGVEE